MTEEQTASLFEEGYPPATDEIYKSKDIEEMNGHFLMFNHMVATLDEPLGEDLVKRFQDGNGRTGRMILFRECLKNDIMPFIIHNKNRIQIVAITYISCYNLLIYEH